jgi:SLT domain-containing protein
VIGSTFARFHVAGTSSNIFDPFANIAAAIAYAAYTYGPNLANQYGGIGSGHGYALGTLSAAPGWGWVGERGPELMHFRGGEQVIPASRAGGTTTIIIKVDPAIAAVTPDRNLGRQIAEHLSQHIKGGGRIYPRGVTPR